MFDDLSKIVTVGSTTHTIKFGWYGRREETWRYLDGSSRGTASFSSWANFAGNCATCGGESQLNSSTIHTGDTLGHWYRYPQAFYVQDDIKVTPHLTFNVGLRYEMPLVLTEKRDKGANFIPGVGPVLLGTDTVLGINPALTGPAAFTYTPGPVTLSGAGVRPDWTDVGPVLGFAWTTRDDKTVIRGGFRIGYDDLFNNIPINQTSNSPFSLTTTQTAGVTQPGTYGWNLAFNQSVPLVTKTPGGTMVGLDSFNAEALSAKQAYAENYNVAVQREIKKGATIEVNYIGTSGHRLGVELDQNQPTVIVNNPNVRGSQAPNQQIFRYPEWAQVITGVFDGKSNYNGLVVSGKVNLNSRLVMNSSYTWSHSIDDTSSFLGTTFDSATPASSNQPLSAQRGNSAFDQRQRFINAFTYLLPFGRGGSILSGVNKFTDEVIGGWTLSGITNLTTGEPFTILTNTNLDYSGFNQFLDRPNYICGGPLRINRDSPASLFNTACFTPAYAGVIGSSPRNAYYGPGLIDFDTSLAKSFRITERVSFAFRADLFNVLNHTNFQMTSANRIEANGTFGQISGTAGLSGGNNGGPRVIQLTGRISFQEHATMHKFAAFLALAGGVWAASADTHKLTLEDLLSTAAVGDAVLSPDGKTIAMTRGGQIDLMPAEGGWPVTLTTSLGGKSGLSWSPDSRYIAYASQGSIWKVSVTTGEPTRLTHSYAASGGDPRQAADRGAQYSPKGRWILYQTGRRGHEDLAVVSDDGQEEIFLTRGDGDAGAASWSPDGEHISYTERKPEYFSGKIQVQKFDPRTGQSGDSMTLYTSPTDRGGGWSVGKASWSPDGKTLAVVLQESGWNNVWLIPATGGKPKQLTSGAFEDLNPVFSPNGKSVAVTSNRTLKEESDIWVVPVDGSAPKQLVKFDKPGVESAPEWSPDGTRIFFRRASPVESADLVVADVAGGAPKYLTHTLPTTLASAVRMPEKITWKSKDGLEISGILYRPENTKPGVLPPAVLWIHGGPEAQDVFRLDAWAQYLTQHGYVVLEPNYRGGTGYGEKFRNLNVEDSGGGEADDVAAGAQYLIDNKIADPKRLAIGGGSHGGTMVAYMVTKYPTLFAAAIEMFGVVDRAVFNERSNRGSAIRWQMKMGGPPSEKPEVYRKANALLDVDKIRTPLLVLHGENDPQVPPIESALFVKALREHHKVVYYYTYPNELHGFTQREHRLDAWSKELTFLAKYLQPAFGASSTSTDDLLLTPPPARPANSATPRPEQ